MTSLPVKAGHGNNTPMHRKTTLLLISTALWACTGHTDGRSSDRLDKGATRVDVADLQCNAAVARTPQRHRPAGSVCPKERAPKTPTVASACPDGGVSPTLICQCSSDSDCTKGPNGRCGQWIPPPILACSYDECFDDSDCRSGSLCQCRPSSSSSAPNRCVKAGNCTVDSDCGPGGYCSPSALDKLCTCPSEKQCGDAGGCYKGEPGAKGTPPGPGWTRIPCLCGDTCGHGYFCHTGCDTCIDDSDCARAGTCNYNVMSRRWECSKLVCPPVP